MDMKAIGITHFGTADRLQTLTVVKPTVTDHDVLIKVLAFALNPVDTKIRTNRGDTDGTPVPNDFKILGWDGAGVVDSVGSHVKNLKAGDEVYFSGSIARHGCNAEYVLVHHELVSLKPKTVDFVTAASMPLTVLTAWEALEQKFGIKIPQAGSKEEAHNAKQSILIVAGAGGVGSVAIQLAKHVFKIGKVFATAGRPDSQTWCRNMGADVVIDRSKDWKDQIRDAGLNGVDYVLSCSEVDDTLDQLVALTNPCGFICGIVINHKPLNMSPLFNKSLSFSWEFMGARAIHHAHMHLQQDILDRCAQYVDNGVIKSWVGVVYDKATAENLRAAHLLQSSGTAIGKIVFKAEF